MMKTKRHYQFLATFTAQLCIVTSGMHLAWTSPSLPKLLSESSPLKITSDEGSWIAIMQLIGAVFSCLFAGFTVDKIGRKWMMLGSAIPYFVAWIIIAYASAAWHLFIARFLAGLSDGVAFTAIPLYFGEIADKEIRGLLGGSTSFFYICGMLAINVVGSQLGIRETALISSVVPLVFFASFIWMPESPYMLLMKQNFDDARQALQKFKGSDDVETEFQRLKLVVESQNDKGKITDLFTEKSNQKAMIIMTILRNTQQLSGSAAFTFYTQTIFIEAGSDLLSPINSTMILLLIQGVMAGVCSLVVDKTGRRLLLIIAIIGSSLCLFLEGTYFYLKTLKTIDTSSFAFVPIAALIGYVIIFNVGIQPIPLLMLSELFPTNVKAFASCFAEIYVCLVAAVVSKFFQILSDRVGIFLPFYVFSACCLVNLVFVVVFVPETKGKTIEEVQEDLAKKKKRGRKEISRG